MKRISNFDQLSVGDRMVSVGLNAFAIIEFRERHPRSPGYAIMLNELGDGLPKFSQERLSREEWYLYTGSTEDNSRIKQMLVDNALNHYNKLKETALPKVNP